VLLGDDSEAIDATRAVQWLGRVLVPLHALEWRFSHQHKRPRSPLGAIVELVHRVAELAELAAETSRGLGYEAREWKRQGRICSAVSERANGSR